ncbi:MAG: signal peptidase I [Treponema sp.]|jgi:signal peptidase I|nr:signal peptidase I [Treponema sp.]
MAPPFRFFNKAMKFSYTEQKTQRHRLLRILFRILIFVLFYNALSSFFFSMRALENDTMRPGLRPGDRFILSSFSLYGLLDRFGLPPSKLPLKRGNIVLVDMALGEKTGAGALVLDGILRFFTAQRISLLDQDERFFMKRVVGLPGDEISMTNFVIRIRPGGEPYTLTEYEVSDQDYVLEIPQVPALWDESIPFSGNIDRITVGEGECFVLSDDRSNTNDSRTWGPIPLHKVAGKVLFRYWPLTHLGRPGR